MCVFVGMGIRGCLRRLVFFLEGEGAGCLGSDEVGVGVGMGVGVVGKKTVRKQEEEEGKFTSKSCFP